jgi:hypothetical protein
MARAPPAPPVTMTLTGLLEANLFLVADLKKDLTAYLQDLEHSEVRTLEAIIQFNNDHADKELPPRKCPRQLLFREQANGNQIIRGKIVSSWPKLRMFPPRTMNGTSATFDQCREILGLRKSSTRMEWMSSSGQPTVSSPQSQPQVVGCLPRGDYKEDCSCANIQSRLSYRRHAIVVP